MRRFVSETLLFLAIQLAIAAGVLGLYEVDRQGFLAAALDKQARLASLAPPRLVLIGGSSLAFGLDGQILEHRTGLRTVNMASMLSLGPEFIIDQAEGDLRPGDVVVLGFEYHAFSDVAEAETIFGRLEVTPGDLRFLRARMIPRLLDGAVAHFGTILRFVQRDLLHGHVVQASPYNRAAFDAFGSVVAHYSLEPQSTREQELFRPGFTPSEIDRTSAILSGFAERCRRRGIRVFLTHPPIPDVQYQRHQEMVRFIDSAFRRLSIPELDGAEELVFPLDDFFDTCYHLGREGTVRRTELIAERLSAALFASEAPVASPAASRSSR